MLVLLHEHNKNTFNTQKHFQIIKVKTNIVCLLLPFQEQGKGYEYEFQESRKFQIHDFM